MIHTKVPSVVVWGVDPGVNSIFAATSNLGESRSLTNKEYYHLLGTQEFDHFLTKYDEDNANIKQTIDNLPSLLTSNLDSYGAAVMQRVLHYNEMHDYYGYRPKLKLKRHIKKQQALLEMCRMLDSNKSTKYKASPSHETYRYTIIAYGAAVFSSSMKGNRAAPTRLFFKVIWQYCIRNKYYFFSIDEFLTSQICNICQTRTLKNVFSADKNQNLHASLQCDSCHTIYNRDVNASINIRDIFSFMANSNNQQPDVFIDKDIN